MMMPTYSYMCECGPLEQQRPVDQRNDREICDECHTPMVRLSDAPAIRFRGPGFYVNDYGAGRRDAHRSR